MEEVTAASPQQGKQNISKINVVHLEFRSILNVLDGVRMMMMMMMMNENHACSYHTRTFKMAVFSASRDIDYKLLAGLVAGNVLVLSLIAIALFCFVRRNMKRRQQGMN